MGKGNSLEGANSRGLKLTDQFLNIAQRTIEKLIRKGTEIDEMQFGFIPGCGTTNVTFIFRQLQKKHLAKKFAFSKKVHFAFVDFQQTFDQVPRDVVW